MSKISVVIPTLQKSVELLTNLVNSLIEDDVVGEIIVIDNSLKGFDVENKKVRVVIPKKNLFVNPSWNFGVELINREESLK